MAYWHAPIFLVFCLHAPVAPRILWCAVTLEPHGVVLADGPEKRMLVLEKHMQVDIDQLLAQCDGTISKLMDDLRLEERLRQRLLEMKGGFVLPQAQPLLPGAPVTNSSNGGHRPAGTVVSGSLLSHVMEVMRAEGRQMRAREIAERVEARGYATSAKGGLKIAVSTLLAHDGGKLFRKIEPGVYVFKGETSEAETEHQEQ